MLPRERILLACHRGQPVPAHDVPPGLQAGFREARHFARELQVFLLLRLFHQFRLQRACRHAE